VFVLLLLAVNLVSSLVKVCVCPVALLGLTFMLELMTEEATEYLV
jgi:hypothetical protein